MSRVLILFGHPALEKSRIHAATARHIKQLDDLHFHDLYEAYPDFDIDIKREQELLLSHDLIILQHPFYWYSAPALIKQWLDLVLEHGWAYGAGGNALSGKRIMNLISCGGSEQAYSEQGRNKRTIRQFLAPFEQTAILCNMQYLPPFVIFGTHRLSAADIKMQVVQIEQLLLALQTDRLSEDELRNMTYMNECVPIPKLIQS